MCTVCLSIAPLAADCVLGSAVPPAPLTDRVFGDAGAAVSPQTGDGRAADSGSATSAADAATPADMADYLTDGYWESQGFEGHSFDSGDITVNLNELSNDGRQLARWAFDAWEAVANLNFVETRSDDADITFFDDEPGAVTYSEWGGNGRSLWADVVISQNWLDVYGTGIDSYSFSTYMHEIGHALGLGHQGNYDGNAVFGSDELFARDSWQLTLMSYFDQDQNTSVNADYAAVISPMMVDIIAIQNLYGAPDDQSATAGATTFGSGSTVGGYLDRLSDVYDDVGSDDDLLTEGEDLAFTIYDHSGIDLLDLSFSNTDNRVSLRDGSFSDVDGISGNIGIATGTVIENLTLGAGGDVATGNDADNLLQAGGGNDLLSGANGNDTLHGQAGNDTVYGGAGDDWITGGRGADVLGGTGGDDTLEGGDGHDAIYGATGNDSLMGDGGNDTLGGTGGDDTLLGGGGDDALWGAADNDSLMGGAGNDTLGGFTGNDALMGDGGADELWGAAGNDSLWGGTGNDRLGAGDGNDALWGGDGNDELSGGAGNDVIYGGLGDDVVYAFSGDDTIEGGAGDDRIYGGSGADSFVFRTGDGDDDLFGFDAGSGDRLALDDALWSGDLNVLQLVIQFADVTDAGNVALDFGDTGFELWGVSNLLGLSDAIDII